ncbi:unnamed protein product [Colias eurytheme]|nr:unnamed protein product [Colias eurytheme]
MGLREALLLIGFLLSLVAGVNSCTRKVYIACRKPAPCGNGMETELFQEVVVLLVTLLLSYLESCFACTRVRYNDCTDSNATSKMPFINEFVLVFIHIALSVMEATSACRRRKHCLSSECRPCNQFGGPKARAKQNIKVIFRLV